MSEPAAPTSTPAAPMAGAVSPAAARSWDTMGTVGEEAPAFDAEPAEPAEPAEQATETTEVTEPVETEQPEEQASQSAEEVLALHKEWMEGDTVPEAFQDKVIWYDTGKGEMAPIRLRDVGANILMYRDYQNKTTEVAHERRELAQARQGQQNWIRDIKSGDPKAQQMALRAAGADIHALVVGYVQEMAELEGYTPEQRERAVRLRDLEERETLFNRKLQSELQQREAEAAKQQQEQGTLAPDIQYVTNAMNEMLPTIMQAAGVPQSQLFAQVLDGIMAEAATGTRAPDGKWIVAPALRRDQAPSQAVMQRLVLAAKEEWQRQIHENGRQLTPPKRVAPPSLGGSGPAAKPGARGNISDPQRKRFSDIG